MADNVALVEQPCPTRSDRGDVETAIGLLSENIEWSEAENSPFWPGRAFRGPQEIVQEVFARLGAETTGFRISISRILGCGETILVEGRYSGTWNAGRDLVRPANAHIWTSRTERPCAGSNTPTRLGWARATAK